MAEMILEGWIVGKDNIMDFCRETFKMHSWQTVRRWKRKRGMPIRYLPNNMPFIVHSEIINWARNFDDLSQKNTS